jgi:hypothetical protein
MIITKSARGFTPFTESPKENGIYAGGWLFDHQSGT